jgi:hypothetical protein
MLRFFKRVWVYSGRVEVPRWLLYPTTVCGLAGQTLTPVVSLVSMLAIIVAIVDYCQDLQPPD